MPLRSGQWTLEVVMRVSKCLGLLAIGLLLGGTALAQAPFVYVSNPDEGKIFAVTVETEPELEISERRTVFSNIDGMEYVVPMADGRLIKLQDKSRGASALPEMRLILNWGLPELVAAKQ